MPITVASRNDGLESELERRIRDIANKVFPIAALITVGLIAWLLWGLFSGSLAEVPKMSATDKLRVIGLVGQIALYIKAALTVTILSAIALFYTSSASGYIMVGLAAVLEYGLQFLITYVDSDAKRFVRGEAAKLTLGSLHTSAIMLAIPGLSLIVWHMYQRFTEARYGHDLTKMQYGSQVSTQQKVPGALIGAVAKCWQLPFCREGVRVKCPIYHAKTKCWKERVGCMCEENIIRIAMGDGQEKGQDLTTGSGFVPIGDLISKNEQAQKPNIPTRVGPRGVRLPTNPHLTERQKRERCRNCVIYNEHQRQKYQFLSPPITLAVPLLFYLNFETLRDGVGTAMSKLDNLMGIVTFNAGHAHGPSDLTKNVVGSLPIESILIVCLGLIVLSYALRALEYAVFKIKI